MPEPARFRRKALRIGLASRFHSVVRWLRRHLNSEIHYETPPQLTGDEPLWSVVVNVIEKGTKHFRPGAEIHIIDAYAGSSERVVGIGHHRRSNRYCCLVFSIEHVENFRVKLADSPEIRQLAFERFAKNPHGTFNRPWTADEARRCCADFPKWQLL